MKLSRKSFLKYSAFLFLSSPLFAKTKEFSNFPDNIKNYGAKGDGFSDDTKAFKKALKIHGSCYIPNGDFVIKEANISEAKIHGIGVIKVHPQASYAIGLGPNSSIMNITFKSSTSYNNKISDLKILDGAKEINIYNCKFYSSTYSALNADINGVDDSSLRYRKNASQIKIRNNSFKGKYSRHLYLHSVQDLVIADNIFEGSLFDSIRLRQRVHNTIINNNIFKNIGIKSSNDSQDAIDTYWSGHKLIISNNIIEGCSKHGLDIKGSNPNGDYGSEKILITNNQIRKSQFCGISISAGAKQKDGKLRAIKNIHINNNLIEENNISKTTGNGAIQIRQGVQDTHITNNQVFNNYGRGIFVFNALTDVPQIKNLIISKNICKNNGYKNDAHGIIISSVENLICSQNICENDSSGQTQKIGLAIVHDEKRGFKKTSGIIKENILIGHEINKI